MADDDGSCFSLYHVTFPIANCGLLVSKAIIDEGNPVTTNTLDWVNAIILNSVSVSVDYYAVHLYTHGRYL